MELNLKFEIPKVKLHPVHKKIIISSGWVLWFTFLGLVVVAGSLSTWFFLSLKPIPPVVPTQRFMPSTIPPPIVMRNLLPLPTKQLLEQCVTDRITHGDLPGAVVLVAKDGRLLYYGAFGYAMITPQMRPMMPDTIFDMASLTKCLATTTSIMLLIEQGKLNLADKLSVVLPKFRGDPAQKIRIRDVMTHTSGLTDDSIHDTDWERTLKGYRDRLSDGFWKRWVESRIHPRDTHEAAMRAHMAWEPGTHYLYADVNYILMGEVVKAVSGLPLDQYFAENVAKPLGLKDTGFNPPPAKRKRIAATEKIDNKVLVGMVHDPRARELNGVAGHAGLFSTARETFKIVQMIMKGGVSGGVHFLSSASTGLITTLQTPPGLTPRGLGWEMDWLGGQERGDLFPHDGFGHTGYTGTSVWADKESGTVVIILGNRVHPDDAGDSSKLRRRVANIVAAEIYREIPWSETKSLPQAPVSKP
jgi:CubicO group peptidase (beta-lactamase class C family)